MHPDRMQQQRFSTLKAHCREHQGSQGVTVDIGADENVPVLVDGSRGPSLLEEPLIRLYAWVQTDSRVPDEVNYDMTADQARELASSLSRAADQLDAINTGVII